ncbi:suppressor of tub2 mutation [Coemansia biformis]|uniref:Suppressor of tub2 mutation n=1 Tax=Coemansia biformis TaxID=1286918 RepID=A0A9W8D187_9FUNG|nr:suppressor of tub2 mutation [Coemansia biformis]
MTETLDQLWHSLQAAQTLGLERKVAALDRLQEGLAQGTGGSAKALDGITTLLAQTLGSSQVIACQAALSCVQPLVEFAVREAGTSTMKQLLRFILPQLLDRLGDNRMAVRELALSTLVAMWGELSGLHGRRPSLDSSGLPRPPGGARSGSSASTNPRMGTPLQSQATRQRGLASPVQAQWSAVHAFERDVQAQGLGHKTWRVREMALEWLISCTEQFMEFPVLRYVPVALALLDDSQDAVRFACKRALNAIYHARPELQGEVVAKARSLAPHRPAVLAAITAPKGELDASPASPYGGTRSMSRLGPTHMGRPRSRVSAASRADSRLGAFHGAHAGLPPSVPPLPEGAGMGGLCSMSQLGHHPGSQLEHRPGSQVGYRLGPHAGPSTPFFSGRGEGQLLHSPSHARGLPGVASDRGSSLSPYAAALPSMLPQPASSRNARRSVPASGHRVPMQRLPSSAQVPLAFVPSQSVPADVKVHHVPSKGSLAAEFSRTVDVFSGRETESNWIQRERAIGLYRGIVWGNAATELRDELVGQLKEHMHQILQAVGSLRTSLSAYSMGLCDDVSVRLGPHASAVFDPIVDALVKQCAQTKKIGAQRAALSLTTAFQNFPLRVKGIEKLQLRMSEKSAVLRLAVVMTCIGALRSHGPRIDPADRRFDDTLTAIGAIARAGLTDAQPSVREPARELVWELYAVAEVHGAKVLAGLPDSVRASLEREREKHARGLLFDTTLVNAGQQYSPEQRAASVALISRTPSSTRECPPRMRSSFGSAGGARAPSLVDVAACRTPQRLQSTDHVGLFSNGCLESPGANQDGARLLLARDTSHVSSVFEDAGLIDGAGPTGGDEFESVDLRPCQKPRTRMDMLRSPIKARMSLGLIDFASMDIAESLLNAGPKPRGAPAVAVSDSPTAVGQAAGAGNSGSPADQGADACPGESQATAVAAEPAEQAGDASQSYGGGLLASPVQRLALTPDRTPPAASPLLRSTTGDSSAASVPTIASQFVTPRTQGARYWHGPLEPAPLLPAVRAPMPESPIPGETPQRLDKIESYLRRLAEDRDVDEALFRSLARFAKEESSTLWMDEGRGGRAYLDRILGACLGWLQNPAGGRDAVFVKDSCFDVLRVLVRRRSQHFSLAPARMLLLEVLRNRFFESTILSGSAEDVFYDMAAHLGTDLCFELAEDFFRRAPLPAAHDLASHKPGYAALLPPQVPTPADMDPMGVFAMDNALAGVLEFVAEAVRRLSSPDTIGTHELGRFMPHAVACFIHPRSQVRKAALEPMIAVHERLGASDADFEDLLLRAGPEQLAAAASPLAEFIGQLHRPELRKLVWTFYQSRRTL